MLTKFKLTALFLFALFLSSCSNIGSGRDSSVTVSLGSDALKYLSARGAESTEDSESEKTNDESTYFLTVSLKGDYSATQSAKISEEGASITFGEIPVESKIYAEGAVYKGNEDSEEKEVLYEGKSEIVTIIEGENVLSLVLKKVEKEPADAEEPAEEEALSFTVKFYSDEETLFASQTVKEGETATEPESPSKDGYVFTGWYTDEDLSEEFDFSGTITENITLYAKWLLGTKKAPDAVGDIVFSDGSATPYSEDLNLTDEQKAAVVAVIFYAGSESDMLGKKTLGVGLHKSEQKYAWATGKTEFTGLEIAISGKTALESTNEPAEFQIANTAGTWDIDTSTFVDGSKGWEVICKVDENAASTAQTNYPAFYWCNTYGSTYSLSGYEEGWYMPTLAEFSMMYLVIDNLDSAILRAEGDQLLTNDNTHYLTSNQFPDWNHELAYTFSFKDARAYFYYDLPNYVRAIRQF